MKEREWCFNETLHSFRMLGDRGSRQASVTLLLRTLRARRR
jgi:hypothetical protein